MKNQGRLCLITNKSVGKLSVLLANTLFSKQVKLFEQEKVNRRREWKCFIITLELNKSLSMGKFNNNNSFSTD